MSTSLPTLQGSILSSRPGATSQLFWTSSAYLLSQVLAQLVVSCFVDLDTFFLPDLTF